ncbi:phage T7 F exclusion suppressor FxsA [Rubripirellula tenax]|uniref:Phage T7 F exclusion suppressor FxsA n=1 Tax=Rubripirellula tenax TaxID=2528015 RepID=A0A5C6ECX7_9BACT|nr:FxsA family protein [Rubripirellula tenax]TWU46335.1 phage T7 F exclusion suppressor FxsA [Rubripirellula tenax]
MLIRLFAAFVIVPLVELYLLLQLAEATSLATTLMIVVVTGIMGSMLARREGTVAWHRFKLAMAEGRMPSREIQDGLMIVFAAALLLTPGILTDALGFTLLLPAGRSVFRRLFLAKYAGSFQVHVNGQPVSGSPDEADGPVAPGPEPLHRPSRGYTIDATAVKHRT